MNADEWEADDDEDEGPLVPLGDITAALDRQRDAVADEVARDLLERNRTPPHAMDHERALLGALLLESSSFAAARDEGLRPEHFYRPHHGTIYATISSMHDRRLPVDTLTVVEELQKLGKLDEVGGAAALSQLEALLPTTAHVVPYARTIREHATRRSIIDACKATVAACYARAKQPADVVDEMQRRMTAIHTVTKRPTSMAELMDRQRRNLEQGTAGIRKLPTGIKAIDAALGGGLPYGLVSTWAMLPGIGKSSLMRHLLRHICGELQVAALLFTPEMTEEQTAGEIVEHEAGMHMPPSFRAASQQQVNRLSEKMSSLSDWPLWIEESKITVEDFRAQVRWAVREHGVQVVGVDYVGDMETSTNHPTRTDLDWAHISKGITSIAKELDIVVILMSQLNPPNQKRPEAAGAWPQVADLPLTQQFGKDAGVTVFGQRAINADKTTSNVTHLMLRGKNRFGKGRTADAYLSYSQETTQMIEVDGTGFLPDGGGAQMKPQKQKQPKPFGSQYPHDHHNDQF